MGRTRKSRAEIQAAYRQRRDADPVRRDTYLQKERNKYKQDLVSGKRKLIGDMSERQQRRQRLEWKKRQRCCRLVTSRLAENTPPATPMDFEEGGHQSRQKERGRKHVRREKAAAYRRIKVLEAELENCKRKAEKYKKRYLRCRNKSVRNPVPTDTPRTKTRKLLANFSRNKQDVRKALLFHYALVDTIKERYQDSKLERQKRTFACMLSGRIVKRYKLQSYSYQQLGFSVRQWSKLSSQSASEIFEARRRRFAANIRMKDDVKTFYLRDDVSRTTAGKKETVTKNKCKMQKRLLVDTLSNTHLKFLAEYHLYSVSYSMFCRMRPFWVVPAAERDRHTCLCKTHENIQLIIDKLVELRILSSVTVDHLCDATVCDAQNKDCMYGKCSVCVNHEVPCCDSSCTGDCLVCARDLPHLRKFDKQETVSYYCWKNKVDVIDGKKCHTVVKNLETEYLGDVIDHLQSLVSKACRHVFNVRHQFLQYRNLKGKIDDCSCLIHIDFSENYLCRYHSEIQSAHFGASHKQTTLHTGILYVGQNDPMSFCTISDSRLHEPAAIWAYMEPVFKHLRNVYPQVMNVHIYSDGPTTQYRQRKNFFLFCTKLFEYGFENGTWNFFEASHGKGAADGVGGVLKRTADRLVKQGTDLPDALTVYEKLLAVTNVQLYFVSEDAVSAVVNALTNTGCLPSVPGTMTLHQVYVNCRSPGTVLYRDVSCFCSGVSGFCSCYEVKSFSFSQSVELPTRSEIDDVVVAQALSTNTVTQPSVPKNDDVQEVEAEVPLSVFKNLCPVDTDNVCNLIGQYCVVRYNNKPYPGRIIEVDETDIKVACMHSIGNRYDSNKFFWPQTVTDECFYAFDDVVTLIPEPERLADHGRAYNHFRVLPSIWALVEQLIL